MSKIDELINELCPDGVVRCRLGDVCDFMSGFAFKSSLYTPDGEPICKTTNIQNGVIDFSQMEYFHPMDYECDLSGYIIYPQDIVIGMSGSIKVGINQTNEKCYLNQRVGKFMPHDEIISNKFLYYLLCDSINALNNKVSGGSVKNLSNKDITNLEICVPPMEIQSEIVRILDSFTELTMELTTELASRKKQYEYYKSTLLSDEYLGANCDSVRKMRVDEICNISRGVVISKDFIRDNPGDYPVYSSQTENDGVLGKINSYSYDGEYITWTTDGANAGTVFRRIGKFNITNVCGLLRLHREDVLLDYLYYALSIQAKKYVSSGMGNPKLMSNVMSRIVVSVPSIDLQKRIVSLLNRFDGVCYDVEKGIPAEIGARRKQYEFYRDKLLAFDELKAA